MNIENSKTNEPHKFVLQLSQRLDFRSLDMLFSKMYLFITHGKI